MKNFSNSRKSSPSRTPVKKQTKVQSLLDPSRLRPPPAQVTNQNIGNMLGTNTRINYGLGMQQAQRDPSANSNQGSESPENITLHLDANEIMSIPPDSNVI